MVGLRQQDAPARAPSRHGSTPEPSTPLARAAGSRLRALSPGARSPPTRTHAPTRLETSRVVEFGPRRGGGGFEGRSSALEVTGWVPGIDQAAFEQAAEEAKSGCPVSAALRIPKSVKATLAP
jgi:lipoyl-dependent peroxiredoxin